ncbi:MAG: NAD(P)H-dependent oxidoreductase [Rhodobacteraceae bacterium]|nr:NAD(P)H-dependent oxidoreductase [Paracoccaceae bacterium]
MTRTVLHIDSSARSEGSVTRDLSARIVARLGAETVLRRDLAQGLPLIGESWVEANFTPAADRDTVQRDRLALSDQLVDELIRADVIVIGAPIYNFSVPTALRAWIDLVARAGRTFRYTEAGPEGLLRNTRAIVATASGGTQVGSDIDHAMPYLRHILRFLGVTDVQIVAADRLAIAPDASLAAAHSAVADLAA